MARILAFALAGLALPAMAQTTTTVTTQQQQQEPPQPPPPSSTTTVTTQQQPQPAPTTTAVRTDDEAGVSTAPNGRSAAAIIATDALYGGIAGALVGGGIILIDQGHNWERKLMISSGVGILAGAGYGVYEAATQPQPHRSVADADPGASNVSGFAVTALAGRF